MSNRAGVDVNVRREVTYHSRPLFSLSLSVASYTTPSLWLSIVRIYRTIAKRVLTTMTAVQTPAIAEDIVIAWIAGERDSCD